MANLHLFMLQKESFQWQVCK